MAYAHDVRVLAAFTAAREPVDTQIEALIGVIAGIHADHGTDLQSVRVEPTRDRRGLRIISRGPRWGRHLRRAVHGRRHHPEP